MKCVRAFLGCLLLSLCCLARADVIVNNLDEMTGGYFGPIGTDSNSTDFLIGQEFTLPASTNLYELDEVTLFLEPTNGGGNITVSIWTAGRNNTPSTQIATLSSVLVTNQ